MPNKFATKLRYVSYADINPGAGIPGVQIVSANGLFDPDITGVGHQPRGFDQFMLMYDHYTVVGAKITVTFSHKHDTTDYNRRIGVTLRDSFSIANDMNDYAESRTTKTRTIVHNATQPVTMSMTYSTRKFLGRSHPLSDPDLKGSSSSNPNEQAYFHIWNQPYSTTDIGSVRIDYRIDYLVVFTEPKQPSQS